MVILRERERERESCYNPKQENTHESHLMVQLLDVSVLIYLSLNRFVLNLKKKKNQKR